MSAIAGVISFHQPVAPGLVDELTASMVTRGPDGQAHWYSRSAALGHRMLRATPESVQEVSPLLSQDKNLILVWDGRLDNRDELIGVLAAENRQLKGRPDTEIVLCAYEKWGDRTPSRMLGDFAFAIWDVRAQSLFCARDQMGAKPFYYAITGNFFAFASEDECLALVPGVSSLPNEDRIAYVLAPEFDAYDYSLSWLRDVRSLEPAHMLNVRAGKSITPTRYWMPATAMSTLRTDEEFEEEFRFLFESSVKYRLRTLGDPAAMMSGGLDSAAIAAAFSNISRRDPSLKLHTFSAISDEISSCVESQCILGLVDRQNVYPHTVRVPSFGGMIDLKDVENFASTRTHPVDNSILLPAMMYLAAHRSGHRVVLHGATGDLTNYVRNPYVAYLQRAGKWREAWRESKAASLNNTSLQAYDPLRIWLLGLRASGLFPAIRALKACLSNQSSARRYPLSSLNQDFVAKLRIRERMEESRQARLLKFSSVASDQLDVLLPDGIVRGLDGHSRISGRYGMESRDPWADMRLVEFFLKLPLNQRVRNGWTKHLVRAGYRNLLPVNVLQRKDKQHLGWHFHFCLLREYFGETGADRCINLTRLEPYMSRSALQITRTDGITGLNGDDVFDRLSLAGWLARLPH